MGSQENQALLVAREQLLGWLIDVELSIRGILRGFGQKIGPVTCNGFEARIQELVICQATLELMVEAILSGSIKGGIRKAAQGCSRVVREDAVCRRLMTMPSVGPLVASTYIQICAGRFKPRPKSKPRSAVRSFGGITRTGDEMVRSISRASIHMRCRITAILRRLTRYAR
jgi:transposase